MKSKLTALFVLALGMSGLAAAPFKDGVHYRALPTPQPVAVSKGQVEVLEFFSWGCPHCYTFEPFLQQRFIKPKPANVVLVRVPAVFNPPFKTMAKAFYVAESLNILEKVNMPMFTELHDMSRGGSVRRALGELMNATQRGDKAKIADAEGRFEDALAAFFVEKGGIKDADFRNAYKSFAVNTKLQRAEALYRRYRITGVPAVVVQGKWFIGAGDGLQIGTYADFADIVASVAAREAAAAK
jgi:thiol:disulfide interchange protein DsbA